jgi:hypothetical protein
MHPHEQAVPGGNGSRDGCGVNPISRTFELDSGGGQIRSYETALAEKLGVIQQTVNAWITDIRARFHSCHQRLVPGGACGSNPILTRLLQGVGHAKRQERQTV